MDLGNKSSLRAELSRSCSSYALPPLPWPFCPKSFARKLLFPRQLWPQSWIWRSINPARCTFVKVACGESRLTTFVHCHSDILCSEIERWGWLKLTRATEWFTPFPITILELEYSNTRILEYSNSNTRTRMFPSRSVPTITWKWLSLKVDRDLNVREHDKDMHAWHGKIGGKCELTQRSSSPSRELQKVHVAWMSGDAASLMWLISVRVLNYWCVRSPRPRRIQTA